MSHGTPPQAGLPGSPSRAGLNTNFPEGARLRDEPDLPPLPMAESPPTLYGPITARNSEPGLSMVSMSPQSVAVSLERSPSELSVPSSDTSVSSAAVETPQLRLQAGGGSPSTGEPSSMVSLLERERGSLPTASSAPSSPHNAALSRAATVPLIKPFWKVWMIELACIAFAFASFIAISVVFWLFDQKSLPRWPLQITLNTLVSFLTTLAKAAIMIPVAAAISQTQWALLRSERPLLDLHVLDQASRGVWGSLKLMRRVRLGHFVVHGATLTVVSVVTTPVTQLAISYPVRSVPSGSDEARVHVIHSLSSQDSPAALARRMMGYARVNAFNPKRISPLGAFCSTGNCTFDQFESLAVCARIVDRTSDLTVQQTDFESLRAAVGPTPGTLFDYFVPGYPTWNVSLGKSFRLFHQGALAMLSGSLAVGSSSIPRGDPHLMKTRIISLGLIYAEPQIDDPALIDRITRDTKNYLPNIIPMSTKVRHRAIEVLFHFCVQSNTLEVRGGISNAQVKGSAALVAPPPHDTAPFLQDIGGCSAGNTTVGWTCDIEEPYQEEEKGFPWNQTISLQAPPGSTDRPAGPRAFSVGYTAVQDLASSMLTSFTSIYMQVPLPRRNVTAGTGSILGVGEDSGLLLMEGLYNYLAFRDPTYRKRRLEASYHNIATALTNGMRGGSTTNTFNITGQALRDESYVQITWSWLVFLAVEIVACLVFLALTIHEQARNESAGGTNDAPLLRDLKNSSLAPLVALSDGSRAAAGGGLRPFGELEAAARRLRVKLEGGQLVAVALDPEEAGPAAGEKMPWYKRVGAWAKLHRAPEKEK